MKTANFVAVAALFLWVPVVLAFFSLMPARRAMLVSAIAGWLLLPIISIDLPGLPPYGKTSAPTLGILLGTILFDSGRLLTFRLRWYDLPMLVWGLCPFVTSITNGLGEYDGMSAAFRQLIAWWFPYLIGRLYLTDADSFRELAMGMIVGGVCLIPFCIWETFWRSGFFRWYLYGMGKSDFSAERGFRAMVFFQSGLELGMWMWNATLMTWWLRRAGVFKSLWGQSSGGVVLPMLLITSILCKSTGATLLNFLGFLTLWFGRRFKTKWVILSLLALAPTYCYIRINNLWTGRTVVELIRTNYSKERAISLEARLDEEDGLIARALRRPIFGWGGYNRSKLIEEETDDGEPRYWICDSFWTIAFGTCGLTGLVSIAIAMGLPVVLFVWRFPAKRWGDPDIAAVTVTAVCLTLFLLDCLSNGMIDIMYLIAAGGLLNIVPARIGTRAVHRAGEALAPVAHGAAGRSISPAATTMSLHHGETTAECALRNSESRERLAIRYQVLGRDFKEQGQSVEAKAAWQEALDLLTELTTAHPEDPALHRCWCDCANDLAWLLTSAADAAARDPAGAVALAVKTVEVDPTCSTYWNTLGAAHYRAGNPHATVDALNQAVALSNGGTAFDHLFLAMAHARLGNREEARRWFDLAMIEMDHYPPGHAELRRLRDEARSLVPTAAAASH
jgi:tetratricopeptide (TPR) repeat protein